MDPLKKSFDLNLQVWLASRAQRSTAARDIPGVNGNGDDQSKFSAAPGETRVAGVAVDASDDQSTISFGGIDR